MQSWMDMRGASLHHAPKLLNGEIFWSFFQTLKHFSNAESRYWSELVRYCFSRYATNTAIQNKIMKLKGPKKVPCEIKVGFSSKVNTITHRYDISFWLENKISAFLLRLPSTIQAIITHVPEKIDDKRWSFENVI